MNRRLILATLLAMLLAACGQQESSEPDATLTPEATPEATSDAPAPSDEPAASEDDGSASGDLADVIPDELNGVPATEIPGMDQILASALQAQGLDSGGADFAFVTYGTDANAVALNAFRLPGVSEVAMEQLRAAHVRRRHGRRRGVGDHRWQDGPEDLRRPDRGSRVLLRRRRHRLHRRRAGRVARRAAALAAPLTATGAPTAIFLNEGAGTARTDRVRETVELARTALDADLHVTATRDVDELTEWLGGLLGHYETAVIVGGDGSLATAYNMAAGRPNLRLGYIPAGFGNASRHLLRLPEDPKGQVEILSRGDDRPIDFVEVDGRLALFASAGWDALVAGRYAEAGAKRLPGWASAITRSIPDLWHRSSVEIRADGWVVHRGPIELLVVGTTPFYGRGLKINPGARPDAGRLSLRIYPGPAPRLALEAARWAIGVRPQAPRIDATEVTVHALDGDAIPMQADGDLISSAVDWRFTLRPGAVRLIGRWS